MVLVGDDLDAEPHQRVVQPVDRLLVAGNDARREDHDIAVFEHDVADGRRGRSGRALRAARPGCRCRSAGSCRAGCSRPRPRSESAAHRRDSRSRGPPCRSATASVRPAPLRGHAPPRPARSFRQPRDVRGEAGDRDPRVVAADQLDQRPAQLASEPEVPGRSAFVESPTSPGRPRRRAARSARLVGRSSRSAGPDRTSSRRCAAPSRPACGSPPHSARGSNASG